MKPLKLVMSAFGSYGGKETVDFEKIDHGIFLITGDTGAGKTTIFDGVSFALFGETSGQRREPSMMRSQYASEDEETFVSLKFSERGEIYEITRCPSYLRLSKRKNKNGAYTAVSVPAKASLILPDGSEYAGNIRDINWKIQEIIGVDQNQFSQIAMIAQGDYLRLLHASSKERKEIFSKIFNTGIYSRIQLKLKEKNNLLYGKLEDNRKLCFHELQNIELLEDSPYLEKWRTLLEFKETKTEDLSELLSLVLEEFKSKEQELRERSENRGKLLSEAESSLARAEEVNRLFDKRDEAAAGLKALKEQEESRRAEKELLKKAEQAEKGGIFEDRFLDKKREYNLSVQRKEQLEKGWTALNEAFLEAEKQAEEGRKISSLETPKLTAAIARLEETMPLYEQWKDRQELSVRKKREEEKAAEDLKTIETELAVRKAGLAESEVRQAFLEEKSRLLPETRQKKSELVQQKQALSDLERAGETLEADITRMERCQERALAAQKAYEQAESAYNHMYREFLAAQAGIMAESLEDGEPCPVCGALHHPQPAKLASGTVTQAQTEQAKKNRDFAEKQRGEAAQESISALENCRHQTEQIEKEIRRWLGEPILLKKPEAEHSAANLLQYLREKLPEEIKLCRESLSKADKEEGEALEASRLLTETLKARDEDRKKLEELEPAREKALNTWQESKVEAASCQLRADQLRERLPFPEEKSASRELQRLGNRREAVLKAQEQAEEQRRKLLEQVKEKKGRLDSETENSRALLQSAKEAEMSFHSAIKELGFSGEDDYRRARQTPETMKRWETEVKEYEKSLEKTDTIYNQYKEQTQGRERLETDRWKETAATLRGEQKICQSEAAKLAGLFGRAARAEENLKDLWKDREKLEEEYSLYHSLYQTANGKMTGSVSLDFQTYVQRQYFGQMIQAANQRLKVMTDGQFLLQCRELEALGKQGEVGLDLDVYTVTTDRIRDIKTLSGGESFMAALAMALGMADVIQKTAGNVHMDALFIDEGFGALDEDSRLKAVRILQELSGGQKLVGIISHVTELKEQIGKKLVVKKTEKGSRIRWELEDGMNK